MVSAVGKLGVSEKVCCSCTTTSGAVRIRNPPMVTSVTSLMPFRLIPSIGLFVSGASSNINSLNIQIFKLYRCSVCTDLIPFSPRYACFVLFKHTLCSAKGGRVTKVTRNGIFRGKNVHNLSKHAYNLQKSPP